MSNRPLSREDSPAACVTSIDDARRLRQVEQWTRSHADYLRQLAHKLCRSQFDPDDLVQDVFEKLVRSPIPTGANERAWLARVMHNQFIDMTRRRAARREDELPEAIPAPVEGEPGWWHALDAEDVRMTLAKLPEEQRATFELFAFENKSYDEISAALGIAKATVGTRILRARLKLRELLMKERHDG